MKPGGDDLTRLIAYSGPSRDLAALPEPHVALIGYVDSDAAANAVDRLLSARGMPFHVKRATGHWAGAQARLTVMVPADRGEEAKALLDAAADEELIERAIGADGLVQY